MTSINFFGNAPEERSVHFTDRSLRSFYLQIIYFSMNSLFLRNVWVYKNRQTKSLNHFYKKQADYSIALTTAFSASFLVPSKPSIPETVVYFNTYFLPGFNLRSEER